MWSHNVTAQGSFRLGAVAASLPVPGVLDSLGHPCVQPDLHTRGAHSTASLWGHHLVPVEVIARAAVPL